MSAIHNIDEMEPTLRYSIENLQKDDITSPMIFEINDGTQAYRVVKLNNKIEAHTANLVDDFSMIKDFAVNIKKQNKISSWIEEKVNNTYIKINDKISSCEFKNKWIN